MLFSHCLLYTSGFPYPCVIFGNEVHGPADDFHFPVIGEGGYLVQDAADEQGTVITPVSYTHLDVYKRQGHGTTFAGWEIKYTVVFCCGILCGFLR